MLYASPGNAEADATGMSFVFTTCCNILFSRNSRRSTIYNYVISSRLGRNTYKEQYAFVYK